MDIIIETAIPEEIDRDEVFAVLEEAGYFIYSVTVRKHS